MGGALAAIALTGAALACPDADDALKGIELVYDEGTRSIITRGADGSVTEVEYADDGVFYTYIAEKGLLETGYRSSDAERMDRFEYSFQQPTPETIAPWSGDRGEQVTYDAANNETERISISWLSRGRQTQEVAGCDYEVIPFQVIYFEPDNFWSVEFIWIPDLAIHIALGHSNFSGSVLYVPTKSSALSE